MAVKTYMMNDKWLDLNKLNHVFVKSVDGVIQGIEVNGVPAGGGGPEYDTVTVTIPANLDIAADTVDYASSFFFDDENGLYFFPVQTVDPAEDNVFSIAKPVNGFAFIAILEHSVIFDFDNSTGDFEPIDDYLVLINGNATMAAAGAPL